MVQLLHSYMTAAKTTALTIQTFGIKVMSLLFNTLSRFVIAFLPKSKGLLQHHSSKELYRDTEEVHEMRRAEESPLKFTQGTAVVVHCLRLCLPMQEVQV